MIELSVIVPVYNMADDGKLEYCLNSLVGQTMQNMEIIAVDDASTDNSLAILREYETKYPDRVRVIASPENKRQGGARNLGLKEAKGRYIGFMDADDWVIEDMYERMYRLAVQKDADVVGTDMCRVYEHTMIPTQREACNTLDQTGIIDHEKRRLLLLQPGAISTKIYKREIFLQPILEFPEHMAYEDNAVLSEIVMRMHHFEHIPEANIFYYQHEGSTTHTVTRKLCEERMESARIMLHYAEENGALKEFHDEIEYQFATLFYRTTLFSYLQSNLKKELSFVKKLGMEMKRIFPGFQENPYYIQNVNKEEKQYIRLQMKSTLAFVMFYYFKRMYRRIRYHG